MKLRPWDCNLPAVQDLCSSCLRGMTGLMFLWQQISGWENWVCFTHTEWHTDVRKNGRMSFFNSAAHNSGERRVTQKLHAASIISKSYDSFGWRVRMGAQDCLKARASAKMQFHLHYKKQYFSRFDLPKVMRKLWWHPHRISTAVGTLIRTIGWFGVKEELWNMNSWSASFCRLNPCESWSSKQIAFVVRSLGHLLTGIKVDTKSTPQWESASVLAMLHVHERGSGKGVYPVRIDILPINLGIRRVYTVCSIRYLSILVVSTTCLWWCLKVLGYCITSRYNSISLPYEVRLWVLGSIILY